MSIKDIYFNKNIGSYPDSFIFNGVKYNKKQDLRYGTNPHQPAAMYEPEKYSGLLGGFKLLKEGKSGLSQTNIEDMNHAAAIVKFFDRPACAVMKHLNPSGVSIQKGPNEPLCYIYKRTRDCDSRAAFGSTVLFNTTVDEDTAKEIMSSIVENVCAPDFSVEALEILKDYETFKRNKHLRIIKTGDIKKLPKYVGDNFEYEVKMLQDGSMILSAPFLTSIKSVDDLIAPVAAHKDKGEIKMKVKPDAKTMLDLIFAWYVCAGVRSNAVVIVKDCVTLAIGTGEQDRVGAVQQAIEKANQKFKGGETLENASIASDGFFPFRDSIDLIAENGITGIIQPGGSVRDYEIIQACNELGVSMFFTGERCFAHH